MCPWFALSVLGTGSLVSALVQHGDALAGRRWSTFTLVAVAASAFGSSSVIPKVPLLISPSRIISEGRTTGSQLRLMDWLGEISRTGPAVCVVPCHPIRATNAWRSWDAWAY